MKLGDTHLGLLKAIRSGVVVRYSRGGRNSSLPRGWFRSDTESNVSRFVDALVDAGEVRIEKDKHDRKFLAPRYRGNDPDTTTNESDGKED